MIGRLQPNGWLGTRAAAVAGSRTMRAITSPYSSVAIRLASMSKNTSPQLTAPATPCFLDRAQPLLPAGRFQGWSAEHVEHHRERAQPGGADGVFTLGGADLAVPPLQFVQLARSQRAHRPRQRVGR